MANMLQNVCNVSLLMLSWLSLAGTQLTGSVAGDIDIALRILGALAPFAPTVFNLLGSLTATTTPRPKPPTTALPLRFLFPLGCYDAFSQKPPLPHFLGSFPGLSAQICVDKCRR